MTHPPDLSDEGLRLLAEAAAHAAIAAGKLLQVQFGKAEVTSRIGRDIKLSQDLAAQVVIIETLAGTGLPLLTEESGWVNGTPHGEEPHWVVDPVDGSYNYSAGLPLCCVSIALCAGMTPLIGCVHDFSRGETFTGGQRIGLALNGAAAAPVPPARNILATGLPAGGAQSTAPLARALEDWRKVRILGSAALSLAWVASGRVDGYREDGIRWWDVAAGLALVEGAGGRYSIASVEQGRAPDADAQPLDRLLVTADRGAFPANAA
jgi:myo-inositol-1(or 4)-monophosphatase